MASQCPVSDLNQRPVPSPCPQMNVTYLILSFLKDGALASVNINPEERQTNVVGSCVHFKLRA